MTFHRILHLRHDGSNIGAFLLQARDLLVDAVALRLERLALGDDLLAASVPLQQLGEIHLVFALGKRRLDELRILRIRLMSNMLFILHHCTT